MRCARWMRRRSRLYRSSEIRIVASLFSALPGARRPFARNPRSGLALPELHTDADTHRRFAGLALDLALPHSSVHAREQFFAQAIDVLIEGGTGRHGEVGVLCNVLKPARC